MSIDKMKTAPWRLSTGAVRLHTKKYPPISLLQQLP